MGTARFKSDPFVAILTTFLEDGESSAKAMALLVGGVSSFDFSDPAKSFERFWPCRVSGLNKTKLEFLSKLLNSEDNPFFLRLTYQAEKLLIWASSAGHKRFVEPLLSCFSSIHDSVLKKVVPGLCKNDDLAGLIALQEKTGYLNYSSEVNGDLVVLACKYGSSRVLPYLLKFNCNLLRTEEGTWNSPLGIAANAGNADAVKRLLEAGANPNTKDAFENSPLHYAATFCFAEGISLLLQAGADPHARNAVGQTPGSIARGLRSVEGNSAGWLAFKDHLESQL